MKFFALIALMFVSLAPGIARADEDDCANYVGASEGFALNTRYYFTDHHHSDLYLLDIKRSSKRAEAFAKSCAIHKYRRASDAYYSEASAWLAWSNNEDWQAKMNLAKQQLERCVTDFYGEEIGARCETELQKIVQEEIAGALAGDSTQ